MRSLKFARVLITGGAQGIGREMALELARKGAELVLTDINEERLAETKGEVEDLGARCLTYRMDVTDHDEVVAVRQRILDDAGTIDVLVNNAGVVFGGPFLEVPLDQHILTYRVNIEGMVNVTYAFLPDLIGGKAGHLVNVASASGFIGLPHGSTYASSKWAAIGFSESIRLEMKRHGHDHVRTTTVCPSYVGTGMFDGAQPAKLTKMLDAPKLAKKVVKAVLKDDLWVLEPWLVKLTPALKGALPTALSDFASDLFGATGSMEDWRGHTKPGAK
jgi:short-subunit dehydrogenase